MTGVRREAGVTPQLALFPGEPGLGRVAPHVRGFARPPEIPAALRLGTSSWSFPGWRGLVYAATSPADALSREGLPAYAHHGLFGCVGVDRPFYGPVSVDQYRQWADQVPDAFRFVVKADAALTSPWGRGPKPRGHVGLASTFLDPSFARASVIDPCVQGLGDKLGCILLQCPPFGAAEVGGATAFAGRVDALAARVGPEVPIAVEFRHRSLFDDRILDVLERRGWSCGLVIWPRLPSIEAQVRSVARTWSRFCVARWMLHSGLDYTGAVERYDPFDRLVDPDETTRASLARALAEAARERPNRAIYAVVNNKAEGCSPRSIELLAAAIAALDRDRRPA